MLRQNSRNPAPLKLTADGSHPAFTGPLVELEGQSDIYRYLMSQTGSHAALRPNGRSKMLRGRAWANVCKRPIADIGRLFDEW